MNTKMELSAVWANGDHFIKDGNRMSVRITEGDRVTVVGNRIMMKSNLRQIGTRPPRYATLRPTHKIIGLYGGVIGQHEYLLIDLNTNELITITQ
jgi:hypothetical protein